jgi:hypothetical protein
VLLVDNNKMLLDIVIVPVAIDHTSDNKLVGLYLLIEQ